MDALRAGDAGERRVSPAVQPVRSDQGLVPQGLSADRSRRHGAEPQSRKFLCRSRAVGVQPGQCRARYRLLAGQDAAGEVVLLRRCAALPARRQPPPDPGQRAALPGSQLPPRWTDAGRRQSRRYARLRAEQLWRVAGTARLPRAAALPRRDGRSLEPTPRHGLVIAAERLVPADEPGATAGSVRQYGGVDRVRAARDPDPPHRKLSEGRSSLWTWRRSGAEHPNGRATRSLTFAASPAPPRCGTLYSKLIRFRRFVSFQHIVGRCLDFEQLDPVAPQESGVAQYRAAGLFVEQHAIMDIMGQDQAAVAGQIDIDDLHIGLAARQVILL